jgi:VCBS repeat-containing protein
MTTLMTRIARASLTRLVVLTGVALLISAAGAAAETLMMPKRDALKGTAFVVWGITTLPNGSTYSFDFEDGTTSSGTVGDRSYIAVSKTYSGVGGSGNKTITLTVTSGATTETSTVVVQVFDPTLMTLDGVRSLRINMAIEDGLRYLWTASANRTTFNTNNFTSWGRASFTALVVLAFENHGYQLPNDNTMPTGIYEKYVVRRGLNTLIQGFTTLTLDNEPAGNPCAGAAPAAEFAATATCVGYYSSAEGIGLAGYANAVMILPFAGSGALNRTNSEVAGPIAGKSFAEITQRLLNAMAWGQNDPACGVGRGGWNYGFNQCLMDGSTAGWNILAILDAEAAGLPLPSFLKSEFTFGINNSFRPSGSFDYNPGSRTLPNAARAGIGAQALFMIGGTAGSSQGLAIQDFISDRWNGVPGSGDYPDTCGGFGQNKNCAYAMFNVFKGLKLLGVTTLPGVTRPAGPGAQLAGDWYADYQDHLITTQVLPNSTANGHWNMRFSCCDDSTAANTAIAELILSPVALVLPATIELTPLTRTAVEMTSHTVTATAESAGGTPVPGATVIFTILSGPNVGLTGTDTTDADGKATFTYADQGPVGTVGTDKIRASIGTLNSNTVDMIWTLENEAPAATDNTYPVTEDGSVSGNVITDAPPDTDENGDAMTATVLTNVTHGTLVFAATGDFTYTPTANYCGTDSFTYEVSDGQLTSNTATVTFNVACVNDPPVADDSSQTTGEDTPFTGNVTSSDIDGGPPTYVVTSGPTNGSVVMAPNGSYTYTPSANYFGPDSFTFTVSDGNGGTDTGTVSITVTPVNDPPVCTAAAPTVATLWPVNHQLHTINVLGVVDPVEGSGITINVTGIFQDEPTNTQGDGNTPVDGFGVGTATAQVRAERSGSKQVPGDGRMYYINFTGTDAQGGTCTGTVRVGVPHDQGQRSTVVGGGPLYRSTGS